MSEKKRINIYMPAELHDKLKYIADSYGNSVNGYLVWLIQMNVANYERVTKQVEEAKQAEQVEAVEVKPVVTRPVETKEVSVKTNDFSSRIRERLAKSKHERK